MSKMHIDNRVAVVDSKFSLVTNKKTAKKGITSQFVFTGDLSYTAIYDNCYRLLSTRGDVENVKITKVFECTAGHINPGCFIHNTRTEECHIYVKPSRREVPDSWDDLIGDMKRLFEHAKDKKKSEQSEKEE